MIVTERCLYYCDCRISPRCRYRVRTAITTLRFACVVLIALRAWRFSEAINVAPNNHPQKKIFSNQLQPFILFIL